MQWSNPVNCSERILGSNLGDAMDVYMMPKRTRRMQAAALQTYECNNGPKNWVED